MPAAAPDRWGGTLLRVLIPIPEFCQYTEESGEFVVSESPS